MKVFRQAKKVLACTLPSLAFSTPHPTATVTVSPCTRSPLHKLTFIQKVRYHPEQVDIQNAAGILASQFDYNGLSTNMHVQQGPLLDAALEPGNAHHRSSYTSDFPLPPRTQLGLDIPVQSLSNTRLPPPPTQVGGQVFFNSSPDRHYPPQDPSHGTAYSSGGMPMDHQASSSSGQPAQGSAAGNASQEQPQRKESSGIVIACRQWYVGYPRSPPLLLTRGAGSTAEPVKFAAIPLDPYATTASADQTSANMTQPPNGGAQTNVRARVRGPARKGQLTGLPRHRHQKGNAQVLLDKQLIIWGLPQLLPASRRTWRA
jgi:hypothetical protein